MGEPKGLSFRSLLLEICDDLGKEEVEALKFFCSDILPGKKLQDATSAEKFFQLLIEQDRVDEDEQFLVAELLYRIRQYSLLKKLKLTKSAVQAALPTKGTLSPYRQLLYDISEDIGSVEQDEMIFLLNDVLPKRNRENMNMLQLLTHLETQALLSSDNLDTLETICKKISPDLVKKITNYKAENVRLPSQETKPPPDATTSQEESAAEPRSIYHSALESFPCSTGDTSCNYPTQIYYDKAERVSQSLSQLHLRPAPETCCLDGNVEELPVYRMGEKCRGYCVIISNEQFKKKKIRKGTNKDADALLCVFTWLGLEANIYRDQTSSDILKCLQAYQEKDHSNMDCFVCCILSHGESGSVQGSDDQLVPIQKLTKYFTAKKCRSLAKKPKLFFIQACQGNLIQPPALIEEDSATSEQSPPRSIPDVADFLLGMSTVDGFAAFRHVETGSWYIQSLCKNLATLVPRHEDLLSILIKVNEEVSDQVDCSGQMKQMPQPAYTLRKKVIFPVPTEPPPSLI
ncbi:caspase-10-like [Ambystoma mexicanum]|uniref:caspase-10-like n=1 Tax=Ambystoma mexicanum TaxID=8296 RepID=UPI0037E7E665